ncbi:Peroxisomal 2,4-dienoyl-CoA reductase [Manis javanica]|nr:Peroxisomal 2,4-dienoyl-CoA reductase [Manis javanica]
MAVTDLNALREVEKGGHVPRVPTAEPGPGGKGGGAVVRYSPATSTRALTRAALCPQPGAGPAPLEPGRKDRAPRRGRRRTRAVLPGARGGDRPEGCRGRTCGRAGAAGNFLCPASVLSFNAFKTVMDIDALEHGCFMRGPRRGDCEHHCDPGYRGQVLQVHTGSAKAAMDAMTRHLAVEWGPQNIGVNSLAPGPISGTEGFQWLGAGRLKQRKHSEGEAGPQPVLDLWNASSGFLWDPPPLQPRALDLMIPAEFLKQRLEGPCCVHGPSLGPSPVLRQYSGREAGLLTACTRVSGVVSIPELP